MLGEVIFLIVGLIIKYISTEHTLYNIILAKLLISSFAHIYILLYT